MKPQKQNWDTRAWLAGIVGGSVVGSLTAWSTYPPFQKRLNALPHLSFVGQHSADVISAIFSIVGLLVLPGLLSGLSRRLTFLWGLLPLSTFLIAMELEDCVESGIKNITQEWWMILRVLSVSFLVSSGPVSLIRWLRVRANRRQEALLGSYQAMREAATVPQEGVWPPPPDYKSTMP